MALAAIATITLRKEIAQIISLKDEQSSQSSLIDQISSTLLYPL